MVSFPRPERFKGPLPIALQRDSSRCRGGFFNLFRRRAGNGCELHGPGKARATGPRALRAARAFPATDGRGSATLDCIKTCTPPRWEYARLGEGLALRARQGRVAERPRLRVLHEVLAVQGAPAARAAGLGEAAQSLGGAPPPFFLLGPGALLPATIHPSRTSPLIADELRGSSRKGAGRCYLCPRMASRWALKSSFPGWRASALSMCRSASAFRPSLK